MQVIRDKAGGGFEVATIVEGGTFSIDETDPLNPIFTASAGGVPTQITVADTTDATCSVALFESATGDLAPKTDGGLTYNASTGTLTAAAFAGPLTGDVTGNVTGNVSGSSGSCTGNSATVTVADAAGDTTTWVLLGTAQTGSIAPATDAGLTYNATTNALTATTFVGALTGNADTVTTNANLTGDVTSSGNAATIANDAVTNAKMADAAAWTVKIRNAGTTGDLSDAALADITTEGSPASGDFLLGFLDSGEIRKFDVSTIGSGGVPTQITVADTTDSTCSVALFESATGDLSPKTDGGLTYDASTGTLTATAFAGPLTGNVTGNVSGSSGSCTGNSATVTTNANLTGPVTSSGNATTIANDAVTNAIMDNAAAWTLKMRNAGTTGDLSDAALADITTEGSPASGDFVLGFLDSGEIRKFDVSTIGGGGVPTQITVADTTDSTCFVALFESATGDLAPKTDAGLTYDANAGTLNGIISVAVKAGSVVVSNDILGTDPVYPTFVATHGAGGFPITIADTKLSFVPSTGILTATGFAGPLTGNVTGNASGSSGSCTGNSATVTVADAGGDTTTWVLLGTAQTGSLAPATDAGLTYNATTNALTATTFVGALTGNADTVTGFTGTSSGTNTGDQSLFRTIAVSGQSDVVADSTTDTLTLVGSGVTITTNATTDTITFTVTGGSGTVTSVASADSSATITNGTTTPDIAINKSWFNGCSLVNGYIVESHTGNAATFAIKNANTAGDPSATNPVFVTFINTDGTSTVITLTAANSVTVSSGSKLGAFNGIAFKVWLVGFNDAGTFRLGVVNATLFTLRTATGFYDATNQLCIRNGDTRSSTAEGGAGAADSACVIYTGTAVTSKQMAVLGHFDYNSGLATAGTWVTSPTPFRLHQFGMPLPGQPIGDPVGTNDGEYSTTSTGTPGDDTIPQSSEGGQFFSVSLAPKSAANILDITVVMNGGSSNGSQAYTALFQDSTANCFAVVASNQSAVIAMNCRGKIIAGTTSSTTIKSRTGISNSGTFYFNGYAGRNMGGAFASFIDVREIMG